MVMMRLAIHIYIGGSKTCHDGDGTHCVIWPIKIQTIHQLFFGVLLQCAWL